MLCRGAGVGTEEELQWGMTACLAGQGLGGARDLLCLRPGAEEPQPLLQQSELSSTQAAWAPVS